MPGRFTASQQDGPGTQPPSPSRTARPALSAHDSTFLRDVHAGLAAPHTGQKTLPCKYLYDARGAALFEQICTLNEYYPTRAELQIMERHARDMAALIGPGAAVIEPGSGAGIKTRLLLEALENPAAYIPMDISSEQLERTARQISRDFPALPVHPIHADFAARPLPPLPPLHAPRPRRLIYFPGSTIGNFDPPDARSFLKRLAALAAPGGALLIGVDLRKDRATLERAYNDARGITAAFNLNILQRINRELGADFDIGSFQHRAFYSAGRGRIEMHLISLADQVVTVAGRPFRFSAGESIHTESSHKYDPEDLRALLASSAWRPSERHWTDEGGRFGVFFASR
jgi:L-histidine Nalpha-methyltransferase